MQDLLNIDLNELVTKEISEKISSLEQENNRQSEVIATQRNEISSLKKTVSNVQIVTGFWDHLRSEYSNITQGKVDKNGWFDSKQKNQFLFIEKTLSNFFNINKEQNGWLSSRSDGGLAVYLAVNFYTHKQEVINLLQVLKDDCSKEVEFIKSFKMPYDYDKSAVIRYVLEPNYNTNRCIFGISQYWIEGGAKKENVPHDLIMRNPFIVEPDVFAMIINSINKRVSNYYYLFALPLYNNHVSKEQIEQLGECLLKMGKSETDYDNVKSFISKFLLRFNNTTLDHLYARISNGNQFNTLHWENFPVEYQKRYLSTMDVQMVLKTLHDYSCKWTTEEKASFLKEYLNK